MTPCKCTQQNQKDIAIHSAEQAVRPWSAISGLGERQGAVRHLGYYQPQPQPQADSIADVIQENSQHWHQQQRQQQQPPLQPQRQSRQSSHNAAYEKSVAAAMSAAARSVRRAGAGQQERATAWQAVVGAPARDIWPQDLIQVTLKPVSAPCRHVIQLVMLKCQL